MGKETKAVKTENQAVTDPGSVQKEFRGLAYQLFREGECGLGHDVEHWLETKRRVLARPHYLDKTTSWHRGMQKNSVVTSQLPLVNA